MLRDLLKNEREEKYMERNNMIDTNNKQIVTVKPKKTGEILGLSTQKVYELANNEILTNIGNGGTMKFDLDEVLQIKAKFNQESYLTSVYDEMVLDYDESFKVLEAIQNPNSRLKPFRYADTFTKYAITNKGRIFNLKNNKELSQNKAAHGYLQVGICNIDERVHVIVAYAWCQNRLCKSEVHHIDGDKTNNNHLNLIWVNKAEHEKLHVLLDMAKKDNDYSEYNSMIKSIQAENQYEEELRCLLFPKDRTIIVVWLPKQTYLDYKAGKITLWDIDYTQERDNYIVSTSYISSKYKETEEMNEHNSN